jgi:hypothetical protein
MDALGGLCNPGLIVARRKSARAAALSTTGGRSGIAEDTPTRKVRRRPDAR